MATHSSILFFFFYSRFSQCLVNKKGSIFFTLAIVKDAGIDQGMLRLACIKKNATLTEHMSFKKG